MFIGCSSNAIAQETGLSRQAINRNLKEIRRALYTSGRFINESIQYIGNEPKAFSLDHFDVIGNAFRGIYNSDDKILGNLYECVTSCPMTRIASEVAILFNTDMPTLFVRYDGIEGGKALFELSHDLRKKEFCKSCCFESGSLIRSFYTKYLFSFIDLSIYFSKQKVRDKDIIPLLVIEAMIISLWKDRSRFISSNSSSEEMFNELDGKFLLDANSFINLSFEILLQTYS